MTVYVDVSHPDLVPEAVLDLIQRQSAARPSENMLFTVSPATLSLYRRGLRNPVPCSQPEADEINQFIGAELGPGDYLMSARADCTYCDRTLTLYDVFVSGRKRHGDEFIRRFMGNGAHLQVAAADDAMPVTCTNCDTVNELATGKAFPVHYSGGTYGYC